MIFNEGLRALRKGITAAATSIFQPPPSLTVSQWADENRRLPSTSAEPGQWRTSRVPYLRRIMDVLGDEITREVVFAKSAQVGGSSCAENFLGYIIDQAPSAVLEVWPTAEAIKAWSTKRLDPMLSDTPCLAKKFPKSGRRDSKDSIASKEFPGGYIQAISAKSTANLRGHSSRVAVAEEVDEWEGDVGDQGDPLELLRARMRTFWNGKLFMVSTPTTAGFSRIWQELTTSTWDEFWVPCPHCQHMQTLRWKDGEDDRYGSGQYRLVWDKDAEGDLIPGTVCYVCENCAALIEERSKGWLLERGEWRPRFPGRIKVGFHINTIYSPLCSWEEIVRSFGRALKAPTQMKSFVNTMLGLPYAEDGEKVDAHFLAKRTEPYAIGTLPIGVGILTAGVDVQGDRLELAVWGWGAGEESWLITWEQLDGDPAQDQVWKDLEARLLTMWKHENGGVSRIAAVCIDAGYQTDRVHKFCDARASRKVVAVVGRSGRGRKLIQAPGPKKYRRSSQKRPTHVVGVDSGKDLLYGRLKITKKEGMSALPLAGYVHFPEEIDPVFFEQLTAEKLVTRYTRGRPERIWVKPSDLRNEALDLTLYAMAALYFLGARVIKELPALAERLSAAPSPSDSPPGAGRQRGYRVLSGGIS